jgi:small-conductance mechanosensitive channel
VQAEIDSERHLLSNARPEQKNQLQAKISELQGELDLINARKSLLGTLSSFANQRDPNGSGGNALKAQIEAMAVTMPSAANATGAPPITAASPAGNSAPAGGNTAAAPLSAPLTALTGASSSAAARFGIWDLAANAVRLSEKIATIDIIDARTAALQALFSRTSAPLISQLKALSAHGDALANQADSADSATLNEVRVQLDALSEQFKQTSAMLIPLGKEGVLLNQYRRTIGNWHDAVKGQYVNALKTLGVRIGVLAVLLALVFAAAEVWRRAVMRYIPDSRRRYQFLLLRRIALWFLVIVIVGFAFASELGSIVTFAGLITAGLAVAMQSVLVSIVGYFFLIGKYGIRIGDRVQIGDVTGEVIELGLVRLYLMELGNRGLSGPTGRVVAFANSIVFQVSSGLFKQIHGVNFIWREIALNLPPGIDYAAAKEKLKSAVNDAVKDYRDEILRQTKEIQRATASDSADDGRPRVQLTFSAAGAQAHIQYPVHLQNAADTDERVSQAVFGAIAGIEQAPKPVHSA